MGNFLRILVTPEFFFSIIRISAPIIFATLAAIVVEKAGFANIGLEGLMMFSALSGSLVSFYAGSWFWGFLAGAGGGIEMLGRYTSFSWSALPGYGWTGITIAILAGNNPCMVPLAAVFMAYLSKGCDLMATYANVPAQLIDIVQGVIFLFFAAEQFLSGYRQNLVVKSAQEEIEMAKAQKGGVTHA